MPEVAGRLTECKRLVSLHKLTKKKKKKSFEAYFWEIKSNDEIYQPKLFRSQAEIYKTYSIILQSTAYQWQGHKLGAFYFFLINFQLLFIILTGHTEQRHIF